jgi:RNA polymerase sigma-70 factor (ECF subfamily)
MLLDAELAGLVNDARASWPKLTRGADRLRACLERAGATLESLRDLKVADLYLACACLDGESAALKAFDELLDEVARKLRRAEISDDTLAEAKQITRQVLLPRAEAPPPLADYTGRGALFSWLRVVMARELVRVLGSASRQVALSSAQAALPDGDDDPETAYLKAHYENEFKQAFAAAMGELAADDRRALRYAIVERMSIDEIARLERIHRATAARDIARARARLADRTRAVLQARLCVEPAQLESVLRLVSSQLDVSVCRLLEGKMAQ